MSMQRCLRRATGVGAAANITGCCPGGGQDKRGMANRRGVTTTRERQGRRQAESRGQGSNHVRVQDGSHLNRVCITPRDASRSVSVSNSGTTRSGGEGPRDCARGPLSFSTCRQKREDAT